LCRYAAVEYVDFQPIGFALAQELNVVSINFFLMYFKVFKYLSKVGPNKSNPVDS
jgi:hypothetical protein